MAKLGRMKLGSQGLEVSLQGLGCLGMSDFYGSPKPEPDMIALIHHAIETGVTLFDTADFYGPHTNEVLIGKALKGGVREKVKLATKFGIESVNAEGKREIRGDPEYVRAACEDSLKRLDIDYIDLYYQHRIDTLVPIEVTMGELKTLVEEGKIKYIGLCEASASTIRRAHAVHPITAVQVEWSLWSRDGEDELVPTCRSNCQMGELKTLVEEGKIKYIGLCEASASTIRRAHAVHPITAVQVEWSLWSRDGEDELVPTCRELGIGIVAYAPLGRGFLSSGAKLLENMSQGDFRQSLPRFQPENMEQNKTIFERISEIAAKKGCTPAQLALAWVHHQGKDVCPIPGTTKIENFNQNIGALSIKLTQEEMAELESLAASDGVKGGRYGDGLATWKNSDTPPLSSWKA